MMLIKKAGVLSSMCLCVFTLQFTVTTAYAEETNNHSWYLGAGLGITELDPDTNNTGYSVTDERDSGFKLFAGYDVSESLTIEGFYSDLGSAQVGDHVVRPDGAIDYSTLGASVLWYFWRNGDSEGENLRQGLQAYLHGGLSSLDNSASVDYSQDNSAQIQYGAGLEYGFKNGFALRAGIDLYDKDAGMAFVGVLKRFGSASKGKITAEPVIEPLPVSAEEQAIIAPVVVDGDLDNDGVVDRIDECADSPVDSSVNIKGCSVFVIDIEGVTFEPQSYELTPDSKLILDEAVITINASPELQKIEVQAHTDSQGSEKYNLNLSEQRALSVKDYLVSQGVREDRLISKGYGESRPVADNKTKDGRAKNRRVEIRDTTDGLTEIETVVPNK